MTQKKGSGGAFANIYNGVQNFFKNFELFHQTMINQTKVKKMFKKNSTRLKSTNLIKLGVF